MSTSALAVLGQHSMSERSARVPRRVVALGESMLRLSTRARLDRADVLEVHVAGSESNVAVALAQLGWEAVWISSLPKTPPGRRVANELLACGVDVDHVHWVKHGRVGVFFVEFAEEPRSTTVWYDRAGSAASLFDEGDLEPSVLDDADYAVVSGITPGISESGRRLARRFAIEARDRDVELCVDVNYRERLWSEDDAARAIGELLTHASVVVCSARDADRLWSIRGEARDIARRFKSVCAPQSNLVVVTRGDAGSVAVLDDDTVIEQPARPAKRVDPIGAGDAFVGGLLWGLDSGDVEEALRAGSLAAALKCTMHGDHLLTNREEFLEHLRARERKVVVR
jgi:2-dehydro-3-deoxygluconokinase